MSNYWIPFIIGNYVKDTRGLSVEQHGAYILLLMENWQGRPVPTDHEEIFRICAAQNDHEKQNILTILKRFFSKKNDGFWNEKAKMIFKKQKSISEKNRENGSRGGKSKKATAKAIDKRPLNDRTSDGGSILKLELDIDKTGSDKFTKPSQKNDFEVSCETSETSVKKNQPAPDSLPAVKRKPRSGYSDITREIVGDFRAILEANGQTIFSKDWYISSYAVCESLIRRGKDPQQIRRVALWAVNDWTCKNTVTHFKSVERAWAHWEKAYPNQRPKKLSPHIEAYRAGKSFKHLESGQIIPAAQLELYDPRTGRKGTDEAQALARSENIEGYEYFRGFEIVES